MEKTTNYCEFCKGTNLEESAGGSIPQPAHDHIELPNFHYLGVDKTPLVNEDESVRNVDDFHHRVQANFLILIIQINFLIF